jgi:hypothetical protein
MTDRFPDRARGTYHGRRLPREYETSPTTITGQSLLDLTQCFVMFFSLLTGPELVVTEPNGGCRVDGNRFDALSRHIGGVGSRRALLRGIATAIIGGSALISAVPADAANRTCRLAGQMCINDGQCCSARCNRSRSASRLRRNRCECPANFTSCNGFCANLASDMANCGTCGDACTRLADACIGGECGCGDGPVCDATTADGCTAGACTCGGDPACDPDFADGCVDGACTCGDGPACASNEGCIDGVCLALTCTAVSPYPLCTVTTSGAVYGMYGGVPHFNNDGINPYCSVDSECTNRSVSNYCVTSPGSYLCRCTRGFGAGPNLFLPWGVVMPGIPEDQSVCVTMQIQP